SAVVRAACWSSENPAARNCCMAICVSPGTGGGSPSGTLCRTSNGTLCGRSIGSVIASPSRNNESWPRKSLVSALACLPATVVGFRRRPRPPMLCIESHTSGRGPLAFGPELGLQHLLWRPRARLGKGWARLLGRIKGHESGMRITLSYDRWYHGAETRIVVEQPGEPTPLLPDRQPPAAARVEGWGTIAPRQQVRQHDF